MKHWGKNTNLGSWNTMNMGENQHSIMVMVEFFFNYYQILINQFFKNHVLLFEPWEK